MNFSITDIITIVSGVIAILATIVGLTVYFTRFMFNLTERRLQDENKLLLQKLTNLETSYKDISDKIATIQKTGSAALVKKLSIDSEVSLAKKTIAVAACSVLVPYPLSHDPEFVFLSIDSESADKLRRTRIPLEKGITGYVFKSENPYFSDNTQKDEHFFDKADLRSGFRTENILCVPIRHNGSIIGVMQFLNKIQGHKFEESDLILAERIAESLSPKVADFCESKENFEILGLASEKIAKDVTVLVCDLSNSSILTSSLPIPAVEDLLNEYLEKLTDIGFIHGATVDKYLGDGFIMHFNLSRPVKDHRITAIKAALEMSQAFKSLRESWIRYGFPVGQIFNRITIESGPVYETMMGHPQYRQSTLIGESLIVASNLSAAVDRSRDLVVIGQNTFNRISDKINTKPVSRDRIGKATALISEAHEILSLKTL